MALTVEQIADLINATITKNGRKLITGEQLQKVLLAIVQQFDGLPGDTHVGNFDIEFTGDRVTNVNDNDWLINTIRTLQLIATSPGSGPSVLIQGYGTGSGNIALQVNSDAGTIHQFLGDRNQKVGNRLYFGDYGYISKNPSSQAVMIKGVASSGTEKTILAVGHNGGEVLFQGEIGAGPYMQVISTDSNYAYTTLQNAAGTKIWQNGMNDGNFLIRGYISGLGDYLNAILIDQSSGLITQKATHFDQYIGVGTAPASSRKIYAIASGSDIGSYVQSQSGTAGYFNSASGKGIDATGDAFGVVATASGNAFDGTGGSYGAVVTGGVAGIYGVPSASGAFGVIATDAGVTGAKALKTIGRVLLSSLPTSPVGLASGELWNNSGSADIV